MEQFINLLTEVTFLLLLVSGLLAGAWSFYNLVYKNRALFNDDYLVFDMMDNHTKHYTTIIERLEKLEQIHQTVITQLEQKILQDEK